MVVISTTDIINVFLSYGNFKICDIMHRIRHWAGEKKKDTSIWISVLNINKHLEISKTKLLLNKHICGGKKQEEGDKQI